MKPIAVVYWMEKGEEESLECYDKSELELLQQTLLIKNYVNWTCLCNLVAIIPFKPHKQVV